MAHNPKITCPDQKSYRLPFPAAMYSLQASTTWVDTLSAASGSIFMERMIPLAATPRAAINFQSRMTEKFIGRTSFLPEPDSEDIYGSLCCRPHSNLHRNITIYLNYLLLSTLICNNFFSTK